MQSSGSSQISFCIVSMFLFSSLLVGISRPPATLRSASSVPLEATIPARSSPHRASVTAQAATYPSFTNFTAGPTGPVFSGGGVGAWDESLREKVQVIQENGIYKMWYGGHRGTDELTTKVGYATSLDGIHWIRYANNPIINRPSMDEDIRVIKDQNGRYFMYIEVNDDHVDLMTSVDGIAWTPYANNPVIAIGSSPVTWREGNNWYMLYEHMIPVFDINLATSTDGMHWTDSPRNPVLHEASTTVPDSVIKDGNTYHLYYHKDVTGQGFPSFHAVSTDLTAWTSRQQVSPMSSQYTFYNSDGAIWSYLWNLAGDHNYYLRYGQDSNPAIAPPALLRQFKLDDGSGNVATDSSSFHANGTLVANPKWTMGKVGGGLQLDGFSQYVDTGFTQHLDLWTISAWVKSPNAPNSGTASGPINSEHNFQINWNHPNQFLRGAAVANIANNWTAASFGTLNANTWYHLAATFDGNSLNAYKDGVLITSTPTPPGYMAGVELNSVKLGRNSYFSRFLAGTIDDVRIYGEALSAAEVAQLAQGLVDVTPPTAPGNLQAQTQGGEVNLSWQASSDPESGISNYNIYRGNTSASKTLLKQVSTSTLSYLDTTTIPLTTYFYEVSAVNGVGLEGARSSEATATTGNNPPGAPTGLTATAGNQQVALDWADNTEFDLAGYRVYQATSTGGQYQLITPTLLTGSAFTVMGLSNGTPYFFKVSAVDNANNESAFSAVANATPTAADPSLVLYYKLDEGSGSQTVDSSNHAAPANLINNPTWITGVHGDALLFNGSGQYVDTGFTQYLSQWTISTWVKSPISPNSNPASGPINFDKNFQINWNHPATSFRGAAAFLAGGNWYTASFGSLQVNTWYQLTATYDGHTLITYKNGVVSENNPFPSGSTAVETGTLKLGRHANAGQYFSGSVDDIRVYNRALSAAEVNALAH